MLPYLNEPGVLWNLKARGPGCMHLDCWANCCCLRSKCLCRPLVGSPAMPHPSHAQARYQVDDIYTYTGSILIAVNPFASMPHLYGTHMMEQYRCARWDAASCWAAAAVPPSPA